MLIGAYSQQGNVLVPRCDHIQDILGQLFDRLVVLSLALSLHQQVFSLFHLQLLTFEFVVHELLLALFFVLFVLKWISH